MNRNKQKTSANISNKSSEHEVSDKQSYLSSNILHNSLGYQRNIKTWRNQKC